MITIVIKNLKNILECMKKKSTHEMSTVDNDLMGNDRMILVLAQRLSTLVLMMINSCSYVY